MSQQPTPEAEGVSVIHVAEPTRGDWEALYVDGDRVLQSHRITVTEALDELAGEQVGSVEHRTVEIDPYGDNPWGETVEYPGRVEDLPE